MILLWLVLVPFIGGLLCWQDKQYLVAFAQLPDAATLDRTDYHDAGADHDAGAMAAGGLPAASDECRR